MVNSLSYLPKYICRHKSRTMPPRIFKSDHFTVMAWGSLCMLKNPHRTGSVFQRFNPDLIGICFQDPPRRFAERILIDLDDFVIAEQRDREIVGHGKIASDDQWGRQ